MIKSAMPVQLRGERWVTSGGQGLWDVRVRYTDGTERLLCDGKAPYTLAQAQMAARNADIVIEAENVKNQLCEAFSILGVES